MPANTSIQQEKKYILKTFDNGTRMVARVVRVKGWLFKRYDAYVWGETRQGQYLWPTNGMPYLNTLTKKDFNEAREVNHD